MKNLFNKNPRAGAAFCALLLCAGLVFADAGKMVVTGGKPWIDSDIKENAVASKRPSPKDDFNLYVNYDWISKNQIEPGESGYSSFKEAAKQIEKNIMAVLTDKKATDPNTALVQSYYRAVLDWKTRNALGMKPAEAYVEKIKAIKNMEELSDFICSNQKDCFLSLFVGFENGVKIDDSSSYITYVGFDPFILEDSAEYKNRTGRGERVYNAALKKAKALFDRLGYSQDEAQKLFENVIAFEGLLAKSALTNSEQNDWIKTYKKEKNVMTIDKAAALCPKFPFKRAIQEAGYGNAKELLVDEPKRFGALNKAYVKENLESIKSYMIFHAVCACSSFMDEQAYDIYINAKNEVNGSQGKLPQERYALNVVRSDLPTPLSRAYLARYDLSKIKKRVAEICKQSISIYREMLGEEDWLSEETKAKAIEKLDAITIHSVFPEKWLDYSGLKLDGLSYFECVKAIHEHSLKLNAARANGKVDKEIWLCEGLLIPNAFYEPSENSINMIPGLLALPFYHEGMAQEELLGSLGAVIGHEISHAFDTQGALYDKDGNLANWWTTKDYKAFEKRAQKLVAYYDGVTLMEGLQERGKIVQTEAIADMAGIKTMLKIAKSIPNFDYKKFFEAYAVNWREITSPEMEEWQVYNDPHPAHYLRTNVTLQQFDEFIEAYDIKPGDGMYLAPKDRILVW